MATAADFILTMGERQRLFAKLLARLLDKAHELGFELTLGEAWRPPEMAKIYAQQGKGIVNSLHVDRLAIDLNLFKDGKYLDSGLEHKALGEWWEQQHPLCAWGGRFKDPNHYSVRYAGRK
jgi:hypothetical protein